MKEVMAFIFYVVKLLIIVMNAKMKMFARIVLEIIIFWEILEIIVEMI